MENDVSYCNTDDTLKDDCKVINPDQKDELLIKNHSERRKTGKIIQYISEMDDRGLKRLCRLEGGLINDNLRIKSWPILANLDIIVTSPKPSTKEIEEHPYYNQVIMDVNRSLKRFPPSIEEKQRLSMQEKLVNLMMRVLVKHPELHYYQGYHDICITFLLVLGEEMGYHVIEKLSKAHLSVFMEETMENTSKMIEHIYPLIGSKSPKLKDFMTRSEVGVMFCLSWVITWFGHVLASYEDVARLFDLFLSEPPWMPLYVSAAIVLHYEKEVLQLECEMPAVHSYLSKLTDNELPLQLLVTNALEMYKESPPKVLKEQMLRNKTQEYSKKHLLLQLLKTKMPVWTIVATLVLLSAVFFKVHYRAEG